MFVSAIRTSTDYCFLSHSHDDDDDDDDCTNVNDSDLFEKDAANDDEEAEECLYL